MSSQSSVLKVHHGHYRPTLAPALLTIIQLLTVSSPLLAQCYTGAEGCNLLDADEIFGPAPCPVWNGVWGAECDTEPTPATYFDCPNEEAFPETDITFCAIIAATDSCGTECFGGGACSVEELPQSGTGESLPTCPIGSDLVCTPDRVCCDATGTLTPLACHEGEGDEPFTGVDSDGDGTVGPPSPAEHCCNNLDDDGDGAVDEAEECGSVECGDECGAASANPVHFLSGEMWLDPTVDVHISSDQGRAFDLLLSRSYTSKEAKAWLGHADEIPFYPGRKANYVLGPGWRHSFQLELFAATTFEQQPYTNPGKAFVLGSEGTVLFSLEGFGGNIQTYGPQPGRAGALQQDRAAGRWTWTTESGDRVVFENDESASIASTLKEYRLYARAIERYPANIQDYRIKWTYAFGNRISKVAAQWQVSPGVWEDGAYLTFEYATVGADTRLDHVLNQDMEVVARYVYQSNKVGAPHQLVGAYDRNTTSQSSARLAAYAYHASGAGDQLLYTVSRPWVSSSVGTVSNKVVEEFVWGSVPVVRGGTKVAVVSHRSQNEVIELATGGLNQTTGYDDDPDVVNETTVWERNGVSQSTTFRFGVPVSCESDVCGEAPASSSIPTGVMTYGGGTKFARGVELREDPDGRYTWRDFDMEGRVLIEAVIDFKGATSPEVSTSPVSNGIAITASPSSAVILRASRFYYHGATTLVSAMITESEVQESALAGNVAYLPTNFWSTSSYRLSTIPNPEVSVGGIDRWFDLQLNDYDSNGGDLNELEDASLVWTERVYVVPSSLPPPGGPPGYASTATQYERDTFGRVTAETTYQTSLGSGRTKLAKRAYEHFAVSGGGVERGRIDRALAYRQPATNGSPLTLYEACSSADYNSWNGRLECWTFAKGSGVDMYKIIDSRAQTTAGIQHILDQRNDSNVTVLRHESLSLASGFDYQSRVTNGNVVKSYGTTSADVQDGLQPWFIEERTPGGALLSQKALSYDSNGYLSDDQLRTGTTLSTARLRSGFTRDEDGRVEVFSPYYSSYSTSAPPTSYTYDERRLSIVDEPDTTSNVTLEYGEDGDGSLGSVTRERRTGVSDLDHSYTTGGRLDALSTAYGDKVKYVYDSRGLVLKEEIVASGTIIAYTYDTLGRVTSKKTSPVSVLDPIVSSISYSYDALGRLTAATDVYGPDDVAYSYDSYGSFAYYVFNSVPGRASFFLSDDFANGRLTKVTDPGGLTFFVYDAIGRVVRIVRHDDSAPSSPGSLNQALMTVIDYEYGGEGQLTAIRYPSGRRVVYTYATNGDRRRPNGVTAYLGTDGATSPVTVATSVVWEPYDALKSFYRNTSAFGRYRVVSRDFGGRVTNIDDYVSFSLLLRQAYTYDADGDILSETTTDNSNGATDPTYTFVYDADDDLLDQFTSSEGVNLNLTFYGDGRRGPDYDGTAWTYYYYGSPAHERILRRDRGGGNYPRDIYLYYTAGAGADDQAGRITAWDWEWDGSIEAELTYGANGNVRSADVATGLYSYKHDYQLRRVKKTEPAVYYWRWRYGMGRAPLEVYRQLTSDFIREEFVYLGGDRIASLYTDYAFPTTPAVVDMLTDRQGAPRKAQWGSQSISRVDRDAWGGLIAWHFLWGGSGSFPWPDLSYLRPGQYLDFETGLVENGYRSMIPELGIYTSPEPLHALAHEIGPYGPSPRLYQYAYGNPLSWVDLDGRQGTCWGRPECIPEPAPAPPTPTPPAPSPPPSTPGVDPGSAGASTWLAYQLCRITGLCTEAAKQRCNRESGGITEICRLDSSKTQRMPDGHTYCEYNCVQNQRRIAVWITTGDCPSTATYDPSENPADPDDPYYGGHH